MGLRGGSVRSFVRAGVSTQVSAGAQARSGKADECARTGHASSCAVVGASLWTQRPYAPDCLLHVRAGHVCPAFCQEIHNQCAGRIAFCQGYIPVGLAQPGQALLDRRTTVPARHGRPPAQHSLATPSPTKHARTHARTHMRQAGRAAPGERAPVSSPVTGWPTGCRWPWPCMRIGASPPGNRWRGNRGPVGGGRTCTGHAWPATTAPREGGRRPWLGSAGVGHAHTGVVHTTRSTNHAAVHAVWFVARHRGLVNMGAPQHSGALVHACPVQCSPPMLSTSRSASICGFNKCSKASPLCNSVQCACSADCQAKGSQYAWHVKYAVRTAHDACTSVPECKLAQAASLVWQQHPPACAIAG